MRTTKVIASLIILMLLLMLVLTLVVYAQGPEGEDRGRAESQDQVGKQGLADPPTPGLSVLVMFTGAANDGNIATSVHCTNFGSSDVQAEMQFFSFTAANVFTDSERIAPNRTWTFSTQATAAYIDDSNLNTGPLDQGSGRVLVDVDHLICTAQVLDPGSNPPVFMAKLPLFDKDGNPFGSRTEIYLPVILKNI